MKSLNRILSLIVLAGIVTMCINCKPKNDPTPDTVEKQQINKLLGQWDVTGVQDDNGARTDFMLSVMTISGTYAQDGGSYPFSFVGSFPDLSPMPKSGGSFKFGDPATSKLIRNDDVTMDYALTNSDKNLKISFNYQGTGFNGSRINQVKGNWTFTFTKK